MKKAHNQLKNTCKNIVLVVLVLLLGVLTAVAWDVGLAIGDPRDSISLFSHMRALLPMGDGGYVQRAGEIPAAYQVRMAATTSDGLAGAAYQEALVSTVYEAVRPVWAAALAAAEEFVQTDEDTLRAALSGQTMMAEYAGRIPIALLTGWFGGKPAGDATICAGSLVLTKDGTLFVRDPAEGKLYQAATRVDGTAWDLAVSSVAASPCNYAAALNGAYTSLYPETLVLRDAQAFDICTARAPDYWESNAGESLQTLLQAFEYDPSLQNYDEEGRAQVFVKNYSSLRIANDGAVRFQSTSRTDGLTAYQEGEAEGVNALAAQTDFAQELVNGALQSIHATSSAMLQSVSVDTQSDVSVLVFVQTIGGVPVDAPADLPFARFTFRGGLLATAELNLRMFVPTQERLYVLPAGQAAAAAERAEKGYVVAYRADDAGRFLPGAFLEGK